MKEKQQDKEDQALAVSPLAQDKTYGEKKYELVFNKLINFWLNLIVSAGFTYWVSHSQRPIKLPFQKTPASPSAIQGNISSWIEKRRIMGVFNGNSPGLDATGQPLASPRATYASNASNVLTLVTAGHPILIGSVWLGAKIRAPFVKYLDRKHYGEAAMDDPSIKLRHALIESAESPTLFGAIVGRIGTIFATQFASYTIGNPDNAVKWAGKKLNLGVVSKFPGMDYLAEVVGNKAGEVAVELSPNSATRFDKRQRQHQYDWSNQQKANPLVDTTRPYQNAPLHMGKYLAQDVLYTAVTSMTITPAINVLKRFIPGMTYKPKISAQAQQVLQQRDEEAARKYRARPVPLRAMADEVAAPTNTPHVNVSEINHLDRVDHRKQEVSAS